MNKILLFFVFFSLFFANIFAQQITYPYIKNVVVEGNKQSNKYVVINNLNLKEGDLFNPSYISNGIKYLYKTNMFNDIKIFINEVGYDSVIVKIQVQENPRVDTIKIVGNDVLSNGEILDTIKVKDGLFFNE